MNAIIERTIRWIEHDMSSKGDPSAHDQQLLPEARRNPPQVPQRQSSELHGHVVVSASSGEPPASRNGYFAEAPASYPASQGYSGSTGASDTLGVQAGQSHAPTSVNNLNVRSDMYPSSVDAAAPKPSAPPNGSLVDFAAQTTQQHLPALEPSHQARRSDDEWRLAAAAAAVTEAEVSGHGAGRHGGMVPGGVSGGHGRAQSGCGPHAAASMQSHVGNNTWHDWMAAMADTQDRYSATNALLTLGGAGGSGARARLTDPISEDSIGAATVLTGQWPLVIFDGSDTITGV